MTKIKKYAGKDQVVEIIVKQSVEIFECSYKKK